MQPEDRLDALLILRAGSVSRHTEPPSNLDLDGDDNLEPLLAAADRLGELGSAEPSPGFADSLEALFLARAAYLREHGAYGGSAAQARTDDTTGDTDVLPIVEAPPLIGNDDPTLPSIAWATSPDEATEADGGPLRRWRPFSGVRRQTTWRRLLLPALAAALMLAIGMTTLTAAADAGPGSPLYGLHRWEQNVQVSMAGSAADRTRLHLGYARDALAALRTAASSSQISSTYDTALATFRDEMSAAASNLEGVPAGSDRDALAAQLEQVRSQGRADLHTALAVLPWPERIATTSVLATIGDNVLQVTGAVMVDAGDGQHLWQITVTGSGFQRGAMLLVNGRPAGTVISVTPTTLIAQLPGDDSVATTKSIGVANPDDTTAVTTSVISREHESDSTPGAQQTPESDDHSGDSHGGGSSDGSASPTPSATEGSGH